MYTVVTYEQNLQRASLEGLFGFRDRTYRRRAWTVLSKKQICICVAAQTSVSKHQ